MERGRGGSDDPIVFIEAKIASGEIDSAQVMRARALWERELRDGIVMPSGERVSISEDRLHHVLLREPRIRRKPERIARLIVNVREIYSAHSGRRAALSGWLEEAGTVYGYAIFDPDAHLLTAHVVDTKKLKKFARQGDLLWKHEGFSSFGTAPNMTS